jgi:hypothetical protein
VGTKSYSNMHEAPKACCAAHFGGLRDSLAAVYSSYVTRDGQPVHRNSGLVTERNLNVRTTTLRVGHLARQSCATVTTRIHFDWTTSFLSDTSIL